MYVATFLTVLVALICFVSCEANCLKNLPVPEHGRIKVIRFTARGIAVKYECLQFYFVEGESTVECAHGEWAESPPTCKDSRCYLRNLLEKDGVDLTDDRRVYYSNEKADITCASGYDLKYPEVRCERGEWQTQNKLSPCQGNGCLVNPIDNGVILEQKSKPIRNVWGTEIRTETFYESAPIGSSKPSGTVLYVICINRYLFQGKETEGLTEIVCRREEWTPFPMCLLPNRDLGVELQKVDEGTTTLSPAIDSNLQTHTLKGNKKATSTMDTDRRPNGTGEEIVSVDISKKHSFGEEQLETTTVNPPCSCRYGVQDDVLVAFAGKTVLTFNDEVYSGSTVLFYCQDPELYILRGTETLECPEDCAWNPSMFPSCVYSKTSRDFGVEVQKGDEETPTVSPFVHSFLETHILNSNNSSPKTMKVDHTANRTVEENASVHISKKDWFFEEFEFPDKSTPGSGEELDTSTVVNPVCSCKYGVQNDVLVAFDGKTVLKFNDEVHSGLTVMFYCQEPGFYHFRGPEMLKCPDDCSWDPAMFPSCVYPEDDDIFIRVSTDPIKNMKVGIGGVITVIAGTKLQLGCSVSSPRRRRRPLRWVTTADGNGVKNEEFEYRTQIYRLLYTLPEASYGDSGNYTCYSYRRKSRSVTIEVKGLQCPEISETEGMTISYTQYRTLNSTATFHCLSPYMRNGPSFVTCEAPGMWSGPLPSCHYDDISIRVSADPVTNMKVGVGGVITVIPGTKLQLGCSISSLNRRRRRRLRLVTTGDGNGVRTEEFDNRAQIYRLLYTLPAASYGDSGNYTCYSYTRRSRSVTIEVTGLQCPEISEIEGMTISYTQNRISNGTATFHCFPPYKRDGPSYVTCEASGMWSGPLSSCHLPTCSVVALFGVIPEEVVPYLDDSVTENVPHGYTLKLGCDRVGWILKGDDNATCSTDGKWKAAPGVHCVPGCTRLQKKTGSELVISPDKELYSLGESITVSCPNGKDLTESVERIMCISSGWIPSIIPDCH